MKTLEPGTIIRWKSIQYGRAFRPGIGGSGAATQVLIRAGALGIVRLGPQRNRDVVNPVDGWCAHVFTPELEVIGHVRCASSQTCVLRLTDEGPRGHEYTFTVERAKGQAADTKIQAFAAWLKGDMGAAVFFGTVGGQ